jgi:hypothetical protein
MSRYLQSLSIVAIALFANAPLNVASAQTFGGSPPWGTEEPIRLQGEVRQGQQFEQPIGGGLSLRLEPGDGDWDIEIGPLGSHEDFSECPTSPLHGPTPRNILAWDFQGVPQGSGGVGQKRRIDFTLNSGDNAAECRSLARIAQGEDTYEESRVSGRCFFQPLRVSLSHDAPDEQRIESMAFEAECGLYGALELWRLPVRYVIPAGFTGWVSVYFGQKSQPELPRRPDHVLVKLSRPVLLTSSELRWDSRGESFVTAKGDPIATTGPQRTIWGEERGQSSCGQYVVFFVGTGNQYRGSGQNPALNPENCRRKR